MYTKFSKFNDAIWINIIAKYFSKIHIFQKNSVESFCPSKLEIDSFLDIKLEAEFADERVIETPETELNIIGNVPEACPYLYNNIQEPKPNQIISNFTGNLPIHFAAQNGQLNVIKYLINQQGSGINPRNRYGFTPLHLAAENGEEKYFAKKIHVLLLKYSMIINFFSWNRTHRCCRVFTQ